jgi:hypothetical protein
MVRLPDGVVHPASNKVNFLAHVECRELCFIMITNTEKDYCEVCLPRIGDHSCAVEDERCVHLVCEIISGLVPEEN